MIMSKPKNKKPISRRQFIEGTGAALVAATAVPALHAQSPAAKTRLPQMPLANRAPPFT